MSSQDSSQVLEDNLPGELRRSLKQKKNNVKATSCRVQSVQGASYRPVLLKEGYLHKPAFFRFGGKRKRYCVLRTYSSTEASLDIFVDESKSRYKGSICLDRSASPTILVRTTEVDGSDRSPNKKGKLLTTYIILKVGKNTYHFTTESFSELKEWCALLRQVIDADLFSAKIVEPHNLDNDMVNVQFSSNYIALLCPVKEMSIKRWRMENITSFGQCGGILTFECCSRCSSDPNVTRCSLNIKQEKPATILSAMEKMVRDNPKTSEVHYERSILGDIYHCSHQCSGKMMSATSDTDLHKLGKGRNRRFESSVPPPDLSTAREFEFHTNTLDSNDSGFPGTPYLEDSPRSSSQLSSPTYSGGKPSPIKKLPSPPAVFVRTRSCSEDPRYTPMPSIESSKDENTRGIPINRVTSYQEKESYLTSSLPISYSPIRASKTVTEAYNKLEPVNEVNRYASNGPPTPPERRESRQSFHPQPSNSPPFGHREHSSPSRSRVVPITLGKTPPPPKVITARQKSSEGRSSYLDQVSDSSTNRDQPVAELAPPLPYKPPMLRRNTDLGSRDHELPRSLPGSLPRQRSQSQSDILDVQNTSKHSSPTRQAFKSSSEEEDDSECDYKYDNLKLRNPMFRLDHQEYDETDSDNIDEVMSNLADYRRQKGINHGAYVKPAVIDKVLSKVACDTVKGYAYKISIPVAGNVVYDVPRRLAVEADPNNDNPYAPPKPIRKISKSTEILNHCVSPAKNFPTTPVVSTEA